MSGLTAILQHDERPIAGDDLLGCIDPLQTFTCHEHRSADSLLAVSYPAGAPNANSRFFESGEFTCLLAGDVILSSIVPWKQIIESITKGNYRDSLFGELQGSFVLVIYDTANHKLWVLTDSFGIQPVYVRQSGARLVVSTAIGSFLRFKDCPVGVDQKWVYEYLYFNYAVGSRTILNGVRRLPAGVVIQYDARSGDQTTSAYVPLISREAGPGSRQAEIDEAVSLMSTIVPDWFESDGRVAFGLSAGLDSRALLAALGCQGENLSTFTYGIPGSTELMEARRVAECLGIGHVELHLDAAYLERLPDLLYETVFLSDGLQVINRSHLPFVYGSLCTSENPLAALITGVSGDHLFRDHISAWGNVPYLISADVAAMHRSGRQPVNRDFYSRLYVTDLPEVEAHLEDVLSELEERYGKFGDADAYYRYLMYVAGPKYFGGQAAIANSYTSFRTPYWDRKLVQFAMNIDLGTAGFSRSLKEKDVYLETAVQASVVARHRRLKKVPYVNLPIDVFTKKNRTPYHFHRALRRLKSTFRVNQHVNEENWPLWYRTVLATEVKKLLSEDCLIGAYVREEFIAQQIADTNIHWLGKLITVEIALRLVNNGWRRDLK